MDYIRETIDDLRKYESRRRSMQSIREKILILREDFGRLRGVQTSSAPVQGGGSGMESHLINNIAEREKLEQQLKIVTAQVKWLEKGLAVLGDEDRLILEYFFVDRPAEHIELLCDRLHLEKSEVYRKKDLALERLARRLYGI